MPIKKQDTVAELMAKYEQYQKNKSADTTASKPNPDVPQTSYPWRTTFGSVEDETSAFAKNPIETLKGIWGISKEAVNDIWEGSKETAKKLWENTKDTAVNLVNDASSWANEKGFLDEATNAFFLTSDISQDSPIKLVPTQRLHKKIADENYKENQKIDMSGYEVNSGYINDQSDRVSPVSKIRYGNGTLHDNGCEIIAVNNALVSLGNRKDIRDIARDFETNGQTMFGAFGTSPFAIDDYFKKQGYKVKTFTGDKQIYSLDIPDADTYIISFWNSDKVTGMIHTVSVDKLPNGKYKMYNAGGNTPMEIDSLNEYLIKTNRVPLVLHCIKKGR